MATDVRSGELPGNGTGELLGRLAAVLVVAPSAALPDGLRLLVDTLGLRSAVLRDAAGDALLAVAGEVVHAVPAARSGRGRAPSIELPVPGPGGRSVALLTVVGARPSHLPALRAAAGVFGLALGQARPAAAGPLVAALVADAERDRDELADVLHDGPVQALLAARYATDAVVRGADPRLGREAVQQALEALRDLMAQLRTRGDDEGGLPAALEALSARLVAAGRPALVTAVDVEAAASVPAPARLVAYRLVQVAALAENVSVRVALRRRGDDVLLSVDTAVPLPEPDRWRRRLHALGGDLSSGAGRLRVLLPSARALADLPVLRPDLVPDPDPKASP